MHLEQIRKWPLVNYVQGKCSIFAVFDGLLGSASDFFGEILRLYSVIFSGCTYFLSLLGSNLEAYLQNFRKRVMHISLQGLK